MAHDAASVLKQVKRVEDFRVLMALLEQLDYENLITTNQAEIARDLEMDRAQVNRAIKRLIEAGAVFGSEGRNQQDLSAESRVRLAWKRPEPHRGVGR